MALQWPALAALQLFNPEIFLPSRNLPRLNSDSFHIIAYLCQPALTLCAPLAIRHDTKQGRSDSLISATLFSVICHSSCPVTLLNSSIHVWSGKGMAGPFRRGGQLPMKPSFPTFRKLSPPDNKLYSFVDPSGIPVGNLNLEMTQNTTFLKLTLRRFCN